MRKKKETNKNKKKRERERERSGKRDFSNAGSNVNLLHALWRRRNNGETKKGKWENRREVNKK